MDAADGSSVIVLWHVHHGALDDDLVQGHDGCATALDFEEEFEWDEAVDDLKIIGAYRNQDAAYAAASRAARQPGFRDEPFCFVIGGYVVGEDHWTDGFATI